MPHAVEDAHSPGHGVHACRSMMLGADIANLGVQTAATHLKVSGDALGDPRVQLVCLKDLLLRIREGQVPPLWQARPCQGVGLERRMQ